MVRYSSTSSFGTFEVAPTDVLADMMEDDGEVAVNTELGSTLGRDAYALLTYIWPRRGAVPKFGL